MKLYKAAIATAAVALPLTSLSGTSAHAAENYNSMPNHGCNVSASDVYKVDHNQETGQKRIWFRFKLDCDDDRQPRYQVQIRESDGSTSQLVVSWPWSGWAPRNDYVGYYVKSVSSSYDPSPDRWGEFYMRIQVQVSPKNKPGDAWDPVALSGPVKSIQI